MLEVTYYGNATFAIASPETTVLVDPFLTANDECPWDAFEVLDREDPDALCVTHVAADHVGEAADLSVEAGLPVLTEPGTERYLRLKGVPGDRITRVLWGMSAEIGDLTVRILEARHASITEVGDEMISGLPLSFLFRHDDSSVYHLGDTSIFRDLETYGDLYEPDVALVGVGQAYDAEARFGGPIVKRINELSAEEAVLATKWLGVDRVVPMHYIHDEREQFLAAMAEADGVAEPVPLDPGDSLRVE